MILSSLSCSHDNSYSSHDRQSYLKHSYDADRFVKFLQVLKELLEKSGGEDLLLWNCLEHLIKNVQYTQLSLDPTSTVVLSKINYFILSKLPQPFSHFPVETSTINESNREFYSPLHGVSVSFTSSTFLLV